MNKKKKLFKKFTTIYEGFTLVETIFSMLVVSLSLLFFTAFLQICKRESWELSYKEVDSSIMQLQKLYVLSENTFVENEMWFFELNGEEMNFYEDENKLILEPGYQVFFMNYEELYFYEEAGCLYLHMKTSEKSEQERIVGCE